MSAFAHLHLHTQYSFLDCTIRISELLPAVKAGGMNAVAVTDHGHMHAAVDFAVQAKKHGVKPIFGCEAYVTRRDRTDKSTRDSAHMVLLARNDEGLANLRYLVSEGYMSGFHYNPRIDFGLLREHSKGLIGLTACLGGVVNRSICAGNVDEAFSIAQELKEIFEPGSFFLELQRNGYAQLAKCNATLQEFAEKLELPLVATNDCHYMRPEDRRGREILMCIRQNRKLAEFHHEEDEMYLRTAAEMEALFADVPEAIENAGRIAEMCNVTMKFDETKLPRFPIPEEDKSPDEYVRELARRGLDQRLATLPYAVERDAYVERLEVELDVICGMGFSGYFLIVQDFINQAKSMDISVGPGRGSGAGSLAAYALRITDLDPIRYDLLFERFLNPERVSMPDFDVDFCMNRRDEVIQYVSKKYGEASVGQIATFAQLKARGTVRDVARVMGLEFAEADALAKLVPHHPSKTVTFRASPTGEAETDTTIYAFEREPRLGELVKKDERAASVIEYARLLEGCYRQTGTHAGGVVISEGPLWGTVPVFRGKNGGLVAQYAFKEVEKAGLVKFDFLGLKTLTVIADAVRLVNGQKKAGEAPFDIETIPLDDAEVYAMIAAGRTTGVFQLEGTGMTRMLKRLKPDSFEDIIAAVALYRPGPMESGMMDSYIERKNGREKVASLHPFIDDVLQETYGVMIYQEQVMRVAQQLSGFSLGGADLLRRAMGKKDAKAMAEQRGKFCDGAKEKGADPEKAGEIFDLIEKFARYGFNKSHSAAYALVSYRTAYLKRHYPTEFFAALLSNETKSPEKALRYVNGARAERIQILPPDVNLSGLDFTVRDGAIVFGLSAVRGVGEAAVEAIITERNASGPFKGLFEFCARVDTRKVNKRVVEALVRAGAFDFADAGRARAFASIEAALDAGSRRQKEKASNQVSLFGAMTAKGKGGVAAVEAEERLAEVEPWTPAMRLASEKETLGFYISGHPLDHYRNDIERFAEFATDDFESDEMRDEVRDERSELARPALVDGAKVVVAGVIAQWEERVSKRDNARYGQGLLEDLRGAVQIACFKRAYERYEAVLKGEEPVLVRGVLRVEDNDAEGGRTSKIIVEKVEALTELRRQHTRRVTIELPADALSDEFFGKLKATLSKHPGSCATYLRLRVPVAGEVDVQLPELNVAPEQLLFFDIERIAPPGFAYECN